MYIFGKSLQLYGHIKYSDDNSGMGIFRLCAALSMHTIDQRLASKSFFILKKLMKKLKHSKLVFEIFDLKISNPMDFEINLVIIIKDNHVKKCVCILHNIETNQVRRNIHIN